MSVYWVLEPWLIFKIHLVWKRIPCSLGWLNSLCRGGWPWTFSFFFFFLTRNNLTNFNLKFCISHKNKNNCFGVLKITYFNYIKLIKDIITQMSFWVYWILIAHFFSLFFVSLTSHSFFCPFISTLCPWDFLPIIK